MTEEILVNPELQAAYNNFMKILSEDVYKHLQCEFVIKIDLHLGVKEENKEKAIAHHKILQAMSDAVPKTNNPSLPVPMREH